MHNLMCMCQQCTQGRMPQQPETVPPWIVLANRPR